MQTHTDWLTDWFVAGSRCHTQHRLMSPSTCNDAIQLVSGVFVFNAMRSQSGCKWSELPPREEKTRNEAEPFCFVCNSDDEWLTSLSNWTNFFTQSKTISKRQLRQSHRFKEFLRQFFYLLEWRCQSNCYVIPDDNASLVQFTVIIIVVIRKLISLAAIYLSLVWFCDCSSNVNTLSLNAEQSIKCYCFAHTHIKR